MKITPMESKSLQDNNEKKPIRAFAYGVAWFAFLIDIAAIVLSAIKDKKQPERHEYEKK